MLDLTEYHKKPHRRVGEKHVNKDGKTMHILYALYHPIKKYYKFHVQFESGYETTVGVSDILRGLVRDRLSPAVCGVGMLGFANKKGNTKEYSIWASMLSRCYNENDVDSYSRYGAKGVTVSERWKRFDYFLEDLKNVDGYDEILFRKGKLELDKDIKQQHLQKHEMVYSKETCCFVSRQVNDQFREKNTSSFSIKVEITKEGNTETYDSISDFIKTNNLPRSAVYHSIRHNDGVYKNWIIKPLKNKN